jgi:general secretion pathway protein G
MWTTTTISREGDAWRAHSWFADAHHHASCVAPAAQRGMTLLEMLVGVLILALAVSIAIAAYEDYRTRAQESLAANDIVVLQSAIQQYAVDRGTLPATLSDLGPSLAAMHDPWGDAYQYLNHATASRGQFRKDKNVVPINSDYDLYSMGQDGATSAPLTAAASRDDIVRANDGRFVGRASVYDP